MFRSRSFVVFAAAIAVSAAVSIHNPVMPGDHPDPSVIRVGNTYWAANTSSEWAPVFPLHISTDLQHWKPEGAVFQTPPEWAVSNFWAPELTLDQGNVRVYYAARKRGGPLCVAVATAPAPRGPYTDHGPLVCQEDGSIDPFFERDAEGHPYLIWKEDGNSRNQPSILFAQATTEDGLELTGQPHELIRNDAPWEGKVVEGPDIVRHGDFYYLIYAGAGCCGAKCNYAVGVARSRSILGPWEKDPANPILNSDSEWRCPGHGTAVEAPGGDLYFLYHAYAQSSFIFTGREALIDRITWKNGWPAIDDGHGSSFSGSAPPPEVRDDFRSATLQPGWQWPLQDRPQTKVGSGLLTLSAEAGHDGGFLGALVARSLESLDYSATATLQSASVGAGQAAGLAVVGDRQNAAGISLRDGKIVEWQIDRGKWRQLAEAPAPSGSAVRLRIDANHGTQFRTWWAPARGGWTEAGKPLDVSQLPPWDRGLRIALFTSGASSARFQAFDLKYGAIP